MPAAFERCVKNGGEVRTASGPSKRFEIGSGEYRHYCYTGGKTYLGEKKRKKAKGKS